MNKNSRTNTTRSRHLQNKTVTNFPVFNLFIVTKELPFSPRTWRAITESPGWATFTRAHVSNSLLGESSFTPTTTVRPPESGVSRSAERALRIIFICRIQLRLRSSSFCCRRFKIIVGFYTNTKRENVGLLFWVNRQIVCFWSSPTRVKRKGWRSRGALFDKKLSWKKANINIKNLKRIYFSY